MSLDATRWAWMQKVGRSSAKLVLLSIADRAGEDHTAYPSIDRLHKDTDLDIKTVRSSIEYLEKQGLLVRESDPGKVPVYTLVGVVGREQTTTKNGTPTKNGTTTKNGTPPLPKTEGVPLPKLVPEPINEPTTNQPWPKHAKNPQLDDAFNRFWTAYPKKEKKPDAAKAWKAAKLDNLADMIVADVTRRRMDDVQWHDRQFIPHPASYLRQRRWEDEIPTATQRHTEPPRRKLVDALRD